MEPTRNIPGQNKEFYLDIPSPVKDERATKIQSAIRGFLARKSFLPSSLYPSYSKRCESLDDSIPRATDGKTVVYLPLDVEKVVIKETGSAQAKKRFAQNEAMRTVVRSAGLDKFIIPRARLYKELLIEERLPISSNPGNNARLYLSSPELFDELACQMTQLFKWAYIDYLVEKNKDDDHLMRIRYDNIPFICTEKEGKPSVSIGLIDLERSSVGEKIKSVRHKIFILSSIFPLHTSIIEEESNKNGMLVEAGEKQVMTNATFYAMHYLKKTAATI